jgi:hypothetical protein
MRGRVYKRGKRWEVRWQTSRHFATEEEAREAAKLPAPPRAERPLVSRKIAEFALHLHEQGITWDAIAKGLTQAGVPTPTGKPQWSGATLSAAAKRLHARRQEADARARHSEWNVTRG